MRRLSWVAVAAALVLTAGTSACSSSTEHGGRPASLTYWAVSMLPTPDQDRKVRGAELAKFTKQTGIPVHLEVLTWDVLYQRILSAVASGRSPDLVDLGNTWSPSLQATKAFVPFDEVTLSKIGGRARFVPSALLSTGVAGRPPATIPLFAQAFGLFYNKKLFAAAGIKTPPATWDEFLRDAHALTKPGQWGVGLVGGVNALNAQLAFLLGRQHGAHLFDAQGQPRFDTSQQRAAVRQLIDLMDVEKVVSPAAAESKGITDSLAALAQGKAAMVPFQSAGRGYFAATKFHDWGVTALPLTDPLPAGGARVQSFVGGTNVALFARSKQKDAALRLVKFLTSRPEQVVLNKAYGSLPVVTDAYADKAFAEPSTQLYGRIIRERTEPMPMVVKERQMETALGAAVAQLWAKAATGTVSDADIATALRQAGDQVASGS